MLQLVGTRTTVTTGELTGSSSNEAIQANIAYDPIIAWCFGLANWNFARSAAVLALQKTASGFPTWVAATDPAPPWKYQFGVPTGFIRAQYLTNFGVNDDNTAWLGEPKRFVVATDIITAVQQQVILTNELNSVLVYTKSLTDPSLWPWYFERLVVHSIAAATCFVLTGDEKKTTELSESSKIAFMIAEQSNREEGLSFGDTTPEWIQALGIEYPYRRNDPRKEVVSDKQR